MRLCIYDHEVVREGLRLVLEKDGLILFGASFHEQAVKEGLNAGSKIELMPIAIRRALMASAAHALR